MLIYLGRVQEESNSAWSSCYHFEGSIFLSGEDGEPRYTYSMQSIRIGRCLVPEKLESLDLRQDLASYESIMTTHIRCFDIFFFHEEI